jgi:hypothetical protein
VIYPKKSKEQLLLMRSKYSVKFVLIDFDEK